MLTKDFYFDLPDELIAQKPSGIRGEDRLMLLDRKTGAVSHWQMSDLPSLIPENALMVFNNSKVRRSRLYGIKESTGRETEFLFLESRDCDGCCWKTMVKNAKKQRPGYKYTFPDGSVGTILENAEDTGTEFRTLAFESPRTEEWFEKNGHIPLPPYIKREDTEEDSERYQNIYAQEVGSAACPTAGLHFTEHMLTELEQRGVERVWITLHVGLGTFLPVRAECIEDHKMHEELYTVTPEAAERINAAKRAGRPVIAVGTTSIRTLESAWSAESGVRAGTRRTSIFMYPGFTFHAADMLFTNFHTPESTLLMLVSAFAGYEHIMSAYRTAVQERYRFFSYGDAMFIR